MKAITIRQPWAQGIAEGLKSVETRSWNVHYRGLLAIHAGVKPMPAGTEDLAAQLEDEPVRGAIIAVAELVAVVSVDELRFTRWSPYRWSIDDLSDRVNVEVSEEERPWGDFSLEFAWLLGDVHRVRPVHRGGGQSLWEHEGRLRRIPDRRRRR